MRAALLSAFSLALAVSGPARAEVVQSSDAGFIVHEVAEVPADTWASWAALTAPAKWWSSDHTWSGKAENLYIDAQATGCFCELMPVPEGAPEGTRRGSVEHMHIIMSAPGATLRMAGGLGPLQGEAVKGVLTITLKKTDKGTRIVWEYVVGGYMRFKPEVISKGVDGVLAEQLGHLAKSLGGDLVAKPDGAAPKPETKPEVKPETPPEPAKPDAAMAPEPVAGGAAAGDAAPGAGTADLGKAFDAAVDPAPKPHVSPKPAAKTKKPVAKKPAAG